MATWTDIDDTFLEPGKPVRSVDGLALRDNPIAITEGAAGAPKIVNAAVTNGTLGAEKLQSGTTERDWVLARISGTPSGAVGSYIFGVEQTSSQFNLGDTAPGSDIFPSNAAGSTIVQAQSGTWRCMGFIPTSPTAEESTTLWLRIS